MRSWKTPPVIWTPFFQSCLPTRIFQRHWKAINKPCLSWWPTRPYPLLDLPELRDQYSLAWDDDSGPGYSAALQFIAPEDGDYYLLAGSSLSAAGRSTSGDYRLLLGLDAPQVLDGTAEPTGATIAVQDQAALATHLVQEISGSLGEDKPADIHQAERL